MYSHMYCNQNLRKKIKHELVQYAFLEMTLSRPNLFKREISAGVNVRIKRSVRSQTIPIERQGMLRIETGLR